MDLETVIPWLIVTAVVVAGGVVLWRGWQLTRMPVVPAGSPAQTGPLVVEGKIAAAGPPVPAPLSGTPVVYAEAFSEVTTTEHVRSSSGSGGSSTRRRTETRPLGRVASRFFLRGPVGDTAVDGNDIKTLSGVGKVPVVQAPSNAPMMGMALRALSSRVGGHERLYERRLVPGDRVWMQGDAIEQAGPVVRLTGKVKVYGAPPTKVARGMMVKGGLVVAVGAAIAGVMGAAG